MNHQHHHHEHEDIVTTYHKHMNGTVESGISKKWINALEEQILLFFGKLFEVKGFQKPLQSLSKVLETCLKSPHIRDTDIILFNIAHLLNHLNEDLLNETLPLLANLLFMSKHDFSHVKTADAKKIVLKFQDKINHPTYLSADTPELRVQTLMDIVDSIRKYSEYLLHVDGYSLKIGRSPREILKTIHKARNDSTL